MPNHAHGAAAKSTVISRHEPKKIRSAYFDSISQAQISIELIKHFFSFSLVSWQSIKRNYPKSVRRQQMAVPPAPKTWNLVLVAPACALVSEMEESLDAYS